MCLECQYYSLKEPNTFVELRGFSLGENAPFRYTKRHAQPFTRSRLIRIESTSHHPFPLQKNTKEPCKARTELDGFQ